MKTVHNTALLVMDVLPALLQRLPNSDAVVGQIANAVSAARSNGIPVIFVALGFREGLPEVSADNKMFASLRERFEGKDISTLSRIHPAVAPKNGEIVVIKKRVSAFAGSDLEIILRAGNFKNLVLCGFATGGVVLSTLREAADKDLGLTVLSDCCADADADIHDFLVEKIFPKQAKVVTVTQWETVLSS